MNTNTNTTKSKTIRARRSLRGKWGKVGAPPKSTAFPRGAFTMSSLFTLNKNQCHLSLRNKVDTKLADGSLIALKPRKQAGGKVGRPKAVYVLKENFDAKTHEKADVKTKTAKTVKAKRTVTVTAASTVAPTAPPVPEASVAPATSEPVTAPVATPAPVPVEVIATSETPALTPALPPVVG